VLGAHEAIQAIILIYADLADDSGRGVSVAFFIFGTF